MNPAEKISIVLELLESGLLCKCLTEEEVEFDDPVRGLCFQRKIIHGADCLGREKAKELLFTCTS